MPAFRRKYACAYREPPAPRKRQPRKLRKDMTEEEKEAADDARLFRAVNKANKEAWVATLVPWTVKEDLRWKAGTVVSSTFFRSRLGINL